MDKGEKIFKDTNMATYKRTMRGTMGAEMNINRIAGKQRHVSIPDIKITRITTYSDGNYPRGLAI